MLEPDRIFSLRSRSEHCQGALLLNVVIFRQRLSTAGNIPISYKIKKERYDTFSVPKITIKTSQNLDLDPNQNENWDRDPNQNHLRILLSDIPILPHFTFEQYGEIQDLLTAFR